MERKRTMTDEKFEKLKKFVEGNPNMELIEEPRSVFRKGYLILDKKKFGSFEIDREEVTKTIERVNKENAELKKRQAEAKAKGEEYKPPKGSIHTTTFSNKSKK